MRNQLVSAFVVLALASCAPTVQNRVNPFAQGQVWTIRWSDGTEHTATVPALSSTKNAAFKYDQPGSMARATSFSYNPGKASDTPVISIAVTSDDKASARLCGLYNAGNPALNAPVQGAEYHSQDPMEPFVNYLANGNRGLLPTCTITRVQ